MSEDERSIKIERMKLRHVGQIAEIEKQSFSAPWNEKQIAYEIDNPAAFFIVAERDGAVLGYIGAHIAADEMYIANIATDEKCRRQGVACSLMHELIRSAAQKNIKFITLEVRTSNAAAQRLYDKFGFELCGIRKDFYQNPREDGQILTLKLAERLEI